MKQLTLEQLAAARDYLLYAVRPLEAARYRYHFGGGDAGEVMAALAPFRAEGGGYGRALEPDLRTPAASALATSVALQVAEEAGAPASHPVVSGAIDYLLATYDPSTARWRIIAPEAEQFATRLLVGRRRARRTLWLLLDEPARRVARLSLALCRARTRPLAARHDRRHCWPNWPACAIRWPVTTCSAPCAWRRRRRCPQSCAQPLLARVRADMVRVVETDPSRWGEYVLRPLEVAPAPDSPFADLFPDAIQANLDYLVDTQGNDGAWAPVWSWAPLDAAAWTQAEREWKGVLTLAALRELTAWGRVAA